MDVYPISKESYFDVTLDSLNEVKYSDIMITDTNLSVVMSYVES